ncbi:MAG TPA: hypothetical protein P5186_28540 [Candidatus Paceibacterota bacterium]|nr:hypothetical protein [Verrucomicrobiota bacterium]HRY51997.1 hypothetical protein [Candidatus Paceibacterota bacterium]
MISKIRVLNNALRCQAWGRLSLVPVVGLFCVPFVLAMYEYLRRQPGVGEPVRHCLRRGRGLVIVSLCYHLLAIVVIVMLNLTNCLWVPGASGGT